MKFSIRIPDARGFRGVCSSRNYMKLVKIISIIRVF